MGLVWTQQYKAFRTWRGLGVDFQTWGCVQQFFASLIVRALIESPEKSYGTGFRSGPEQIEDNLMSLGRNNNGEGPNVGSACPAGTTGRIGRVEDAERGADPQYDDFPQRPEGRRGGWGKRPSKRARERVRGGMRQVRFSQSVESVLSHGCSHCEPA